MAELNFGLLTPPGSQSIGNAFVSGMDQAAVARAQENQNALAQYTLSKARREDELTNQMLAGMQGADTIEKQADVLRKGGRYKEANELINAGLERDIKKGTLAAQPGVAARTLAQTNAATLAAGKSKQDFKNQGLRDMANNPSDANIVANHEDAVLRGMMTQEESDAQTVKLLAIPLDQRRAIFAQAGAPAITPEKAPAPPAMVAEYTFAKTPAGGNFVGTFQDFVTARAKAGRAPAQPSAPTITQIVDPTDATKMITIDARRYTGGGAGSPGVIGVSGKEPTAALRENKIESGKSLLADEISNLRAALNTLNAARAIPSTERGALSNISSSLASSGVGQIAGRIVGTEAQTERDVISSSKLRLVNAIKQATGMSAQQLNSNVELQTMLKSLSDPSQSIEANIRNLDNIEKSYVNATSAAMPRASAPPTTPKAAPAPNIDALLKKYE
jgi:hypothetical protein